MPITVIVGGQYGSEGKGKASAHFAATEGACALIRVGGPNSGHTALDKFGKSWTFRQLPAAITKSNAPIILPAGSLIDPIVLLDEIESLDLTPERIWIDPKASVVTAEHRARERRALTSIGSTLSGTGAAIIDRINRSPSHEMAAQKPELKKYIRYDIDEKIHQILKLSKRIVIEGTQGYGLSLWHSEDYPYVTARDTIASTFVSEAGLPPHEVDNVVLVIRAFPIRVGGSSGPLKNEINWEIIASEAGLPSGYHELTTVTKKVRRVARFDGEVVKRAIMKNCPHIILINHMDYIEPLEDSMAYNSKSRNFIEYVEGEIGRKLSFLGYGPDTIVDRDSLMFGRAA